MFDADSYLQTWKNPVTGKLHFQVHPCGAMELIVQPLPDGAKREGALFPDGGHVTNLQEVRELLYKMQRPAIDPKVRVTSTHSHGRQTYTTPTLARLPARLAGARPRPRLHPRIHRRR